MCKIIEILANAFSYGEIDLLAEHLIDYCKYSSDYAQRHFSSAEKILSNMRKVYENVQASEQDCSYSHQIIKLKNILCEDVTIDDLHGDSLGDVCEDGILLYQYGEKIPVAVIYIKTTPGGKISDINLSRNKKLFNIEFYGNSQMQDSEKDIPYTVKPMTQHDRLVKEIRSRMSGQHLQYQELDDSEVYIWRQADKHFKKWLEAEGYYVVETAVFDDCIGYKCTRYGYCYTIYMFAFGQMNKQRIDGNSCAKYVNYDFSEGMVLVSHLNVMRIISGDEIRYKVGFHTGADNPKIELWRPYKLQGKDVLMFYPRREVDEITEKLVVALNAESLDLLECIVSDNNPYFDAHDSSGCFMNSAFYSSLHYTYKKHGKMKLGYMSFDKVIYSLVPYIDNYGWFDFSVDNATRIIRVSSHKFVGDAEHKLADFIKADLEIEFKLTHPEIVSIETFKPVFSERFALKAIFANSEVKKYVLPIGSEQETLEVVSYKKHVFTDGIWSSAEVVEKREAWINNYLECGQGIIFKNGFSVSSLKCYEEGTDYSEPALCDEVVYEDDEIKIHKKWTWDAKSIYEDENTGVLKVLLNGGAFNWRGISTIANADGIRHTLEFRHLSSFTDGLALVSIAGRGCGHINSEGQFVVPPIYDTASEFQNGFAKVEKEGKKFLVDTNGGLSEIRSETHDSKYEDVGTFSEGLCKVSTLKLTFMDLAYHSDNADAAGIWGFINERGEEVIAPQYIYAYDFQDGIALVAKGKWTRDEKWNNKYNKGRYWSDTELWGAIDRLGREVIPCIYDEINTFGDTNNIFKVHYGGWENGKWGVIDRKGNWLAEPIFESIAYEYRDGLFTFYGEDSPLDVPIGVYDITQKKVLFEPQFIDVSFLEDGYLEVQLFDEKLGRNVTRIIDKEGKEKFHSEYTSIYTYKTPYEVSIEQDGKRLYGLIEEDGTVILPCKYECSFSGLYPEYRRIVLKKNGKEMVCDFEDNEIIPALYDEVHGFRNPLLTTCVPGENNKKMYGLITHKGIEVIPPRFEQISWFQDNGIMCVDKNGCIYLHVQKN